MARKNSLRLCPFGLESRRNLRAVLLLKTWPSPRPRASTSARRICRLYSPEKGPGSGTAVRFLFFFDISKPRKTSGGSQVSGRLMWELTTSCERTP